MSPPITVVCVFVKGHVGFTPEYVVRLRSMCRRRIVQPHTFVCLTDQPWKLPQDMNVVKVSTPEGYFAWWAKVQLFDPRLCFSGKVIYYDLDVLLLGDQSEIINYTDKFAAIPHAGAFQGKDGLAVHKRFNSSVMTWLAGEHVGLWERWSPEVTKRLWGDQDWIGEQVGSAASLPLDWFPRLSEVRRPPWPRKAKVVLCKKPKNHDMASTCSWFSKEWQ